VAAFIFIGADIEDIGADISFWPVLSPAENFYPYDALNCGPR
jgi:hypothetical protein